MKHDVYKDFIIFPMYLIPIFALIFGKDSLSQAIGAEWKKSLFWLETYTI